MCRASKRDWIGIALVIFVAVVVNIFIAIICAFTIQINLADAINNCYVKGGHWDVKANVCEARK